MAEKRKLLQEVDKTYKKVDEGIEIFEEIMTKMYEANSENQRDKFQDDLKREIKKLQRLRDLIKGWQFSPDIKDKDALAKYRRLIETKMEQFKDIERENKTKPHSKQGLSAEEKLDPREKEKADAIEWFKTKIRQIQDELDRTDVKMEALSSGNSGRKRKGKDESSKEKTEELKKHKENLCYHATNLEVCMRLVTNDQKDPKDVLDVLQDALDSYIDALDPDSNMDPKELDPYGVYEELEIEDFIPQLAGVITTSIDDEKDELTGTRSNNHSPFPEERPRNLSNEKPPAPISAKLSNQLGSDERTSSVTSPPPVATPPPSIPYNAVAAGFHLKSPAPTTPASATPSAVVKPSTPVSTPVPNSPAAVTPSSTVVKPLTPVSTPVSTPFSNSPAFVTPSSAVVKPSTPVSTPVSNSPVTTQPSRSSESQTTVASTQSTDSTTMMTPDDMLLRELSTLTSDANADTRSSEIPSWLGISPLGRLALTAEQENHIKRLEEAQRTVPHRFDSEPQRPQMPRIPYQSFASYPQIQNPLFQTIDYYLRLSPDTLLFIFYYMEGSKAQLLAAQALKKLSWRFHTKYLMWFQRFEEPKVITDDFEQGSYVYFDFERWAQRKKDSFMFEYRYLEASKMVVLSASLLTRNGKVLVARQFVEITRIRLEGLLAAFPKLLSSGSREHTFIDTESVRYVYQPLESFFVLIITNKTSNIVEDLHTIQVLSKLVPDICAPLSEASIREKQFELVFGFDELITAGGHSENINVSQIRVNMEMESHEEKLHNMILESKRAAAKDDMKRHTARIKEEQRERARLERAGMGGSGFGSQNSFGSSFSNAFKSPRSGGSSDSFMNSPSSPAATSPTSYNSRPEPVVSKAAGMKLGSSSSGKGMGLGSGGKSFMDAMAAEDGLKEIPPMSAAVETVQKPEVAAAVSHDPIGAVVEEKMTVVLTRDGALEQLEVKGSMYVSVNDPSAGCCRLKLRTGGAEGISYQTHPKVDKKLYDSDSVLALRDSSKPFPTSRVAFLRWSLKTQDESMLPLNITCWPEEEGNGKMNVSVEYSLDRDMVLDNVNVVIPLGGPDAPSVANVDGQYQHNSGEGVLLWHQNQISSANNSGTLEFAVRGNNMDAFFPISVSFFSRSVYSDVQVEAVQKIEDGSPIAFGFEKLLSTDSYQIV